MPSSPHPIQDQHADNSISDRETRTPISVTVLTTADGGGHDRYGTVVLRRGNWLVENINWIDRSGTDAISLVLAGRRFHVRRGLNFVVLAGPWYEYSNRAWDEAVIDTNLQFQKGRVRFVSVNHWGVPLKSTGDFFDSHTLTTSGISRLPNWLGANGQVEHSSSAGVETLWAGPMFEAHKGDASLRGVPYWDFLRRACGFRLTVAYELVSRKAPNRR